MAAETAGWRCSGVATARGSHKAVIPENHGFLRRCGRSPPRS